VNLTGWEVVETNGVHVMPCGDAVDHETTDDCVCVPRAEAVPREDGSMGWLTVHHSLDGREAHE
jgi:hypothetical protein